MSAIAGSLKSPIEDNLGSMRGIVEEILQRNGLASVKLLGEWTDELVGLAVKGIVWKVENIVKSGREEEKYEAADLILELIEKVEVNLGSSLLFPEIRDY